MYFKFNVNLTDEDYLNYNMFTQTMTDGGKKQIAFLRGLMIIIILIMCVLCVSLFEDPLLKVFTCIALLVILVVFLIRIPQDLKKSTKRVIKAYSHKSKKLFSESTVLEFFEDSFTEYAPGVKTEVNYSAIECVNILNGRYVFIQQNQLQGYILPFTVFESSEQCTACIDFLRSKISNVNFY